MQKYNYSYDNLFKLVKESQSISEVARKLGMTAKGGNHDTIKRKIKEYGISTEHFLGQSWSRNKSFTKVSIDDYLENKRSISSYKLKSKLIKSGLKENRCELCGLTDWQGKEISLTLHHKDGNNCNNSLDNLQILCPNCHSQTDTFAGRNLRKNDCISDKSDKKSDECFTNSSPKFNLRKVSRPSTYEQFKIEFGELNNNYCAMARKYNVTDNAIRKWIKSYKKYGV